MLLYNIKYSMLVLVAFIALTGCASDPIKISKATNASNSLIPVADNRPPFETKTRYPSFGEASYYPGDNAFQPNIIKAIRIELTNIIGANIPASNISIQHAIILNYFGSHDNKAKSALLGPIWSDKFKNTNFVKCDITGTVNGKEFTVTYAQPYEVNSLAYVVVYTGPDAKESSAKVVNKCVEMAANKIVEIMSSK